METTAAKSQERVWPQPTIRVTSPNLRQCALNLTECHAQAGADNDAEVPFGLALTTSSRRSHIAAHGQHNSQLQRPEAVGSKGTEIWGLLQLGQGGRAVGI